MKTVVYGPAYLDRVVRVDRPLIEGRTLDGSMTGNPSEGPGPVMLSDRAGTAIVLEGLPPGDGLPAVVELDAHFPGDPSLNVRRVRVVSRHDDLGGMGAGFAKALEGELVSALARDDAVGRDIARRLAAEGIPHRPILADVKESDWSLIVSSGEHGDKLAVGFRGCHAAVRTLRAEGEPRCDLLVVASWPNRLIADALEYPASVRFLAPAMRNTRDDPPLASLAGRFDVLSLNRREWEAMPDREAILAATSLVCVTDGPSGVRVHFRDESASRRAIDLPAFPRDEPPRDTNRAGEAFASAFLKAILHEKWTPGPIAEGLVREAALRGSAAAALVLDREDFGFPSDGEVDAALRIGRVVAHDRGPGRSTGTETDA